MSGVRYGRDRDAEFQHGELMKTTASRRRSRVLCAGISCVIAGYCGLYLGSRWWRLDFYQPRFSVGIASGGFGVRTVSVLRGDPGNCLNTGWTLQRTAPGLSFYLWPSYVDYAKLGLAPFRFLIIPLWIPLLPLLARATYVFYRDRTRRMPGHCCKCGYNLTGNTSGRCPECGTLQAIPPSASGRGPDATPLGLSE